MLSGLHIIQISTAAGENLLPDINFLGLTLELKEKKILIFICNSTELENLRSSFVQIKNKIFTAKIQTMKITQRY